MDPLILTCLCACARTLLRGRSWLGTIAVLLMLIRGGASRFRAHTAVRMRMLTNKSEIASKLEEL
jgi:hypothetical protein